MSYDPAFLKANADALMAALERSNQIRARIILALVILLLLAIAAISGLAVANFCR